MGGKGSKKEAVREEVWGENRLVEEDGWGGITSYNLLDLQVAAMDTGTACHQQSSQNSLTGQE